MSVRVLVDTSFLVAQLDERDVHHQTAKALHELFRKREVAYIYLDCVVNEAVTVLARRALERTFCSSISTDGRLLLIPSAAYPQVKWEARSAP